MLPPGQPKSFESRRYSERLISVLDEFGGRVAVDVQLTRRDTNELAVYRAKTRATIKRCRGCTLVDRCTGPVPMHLPDTTGNDAQFVVVGEAPGKQEDERGRPFVGPAGKLLRSMFMQVGLDQYEALYCNVVSCWPRDLQGKGMSPGDESVRACRVNLLNQIEAGNTGFVLLVGAVALNAFRGDLQVSRHHGQVFVWGGRWIVMPVMHPAAVLRAPQLKREVLGDLGVWQRVVSGRVGALELVGENGCVKCGNARVMYELDADGVGWCKVHWEGVGGKMGKGERERQIERWTQKPKVKRRGKKDRTPGEGQISMI